MAQEVQTECPTYETTDKQGVGIKVAFSPSIIEIGYIDEDVDVPSDITETSLSEDDRPQEINQESGIDASLAAKINEDEEKTQESHFDTESSSNEDSSNHSAPQDHVPSHKLVVSPVIHSKRSEEFNEAAFLQEALESASEDFHEDEEDSEPAVDLQNSKNGFENQTLEESILTLQLSLEEKTALGPFEKLSKRNEDNPMDVAKLPENTPKNRYKDVLPYDESRVPLTESETGDYINASFVNMEIPSLDITNEYIATQGPLPNTCDDFWQMIWEQKCSIIVMVTTLKERNRHKCHKYWPDLHETIIQADIQISCFSEAVTQASITRDLLLVNEKKNEDRHVIQIQHVAWPDHGVPEDATDFLEFIQQLREWRKVIGGKVVVHCSAGVGRTGVLILMESVMCFVETGYSVFPLELVKKMREQRVMMVQTVGQYKFICEAILKLYNDHRSKFIANDDDDT